MAQTLGPAIPTKIRVDGATTLAIAAVVVTLVQILHEGTHAITCMAVGADLLEISALHVSCESSTAWQSKLVSGSASIINLIVGLLVFMGMLRPGSRRSETTFFLWLFMLMNWLLGAGYWMFSGIGNVGDWANVIAGWSPHWAWRVMMAIVGAALYMALVWTSLRMLGRIIGGEDRDEQIRRAVRLGLYSYVAVVVVILVAGLFNSYGITGLPAIAALMLALGGMSPLLWMMQWFRSDSFVKSPGEPFAIRRLKSWIVAGLLAVILYGVVLGPTIYFGTDRRGVKVCWRGYGHGPKCVYGLWRGCEPSAPTGIPMDRQLIQYYLQQSGMQPSQAEMLSAILDEMATRGEVHSLEMRMNELRSEMRSEFRDVRSEIQVLRADMVSELKSLEARLTWRFIAGIAFFASVMTVLDLFVD